MFDHPLARQAAIWRTRRLDGSVENILTIITTLALDPAHKSFKADKVARLSDAAEDWLRTNPDGVSSFTLINRPRDWPKASPQR